MAYPAAPALARVAGRLRACGLTVVEVTGWQSRGRGAMAPACHVQHHTAGSRRGGNTASLRICTFGRPGLANALCTWYVARDGTVYLVAAGLAYHAGKGGWRGVSGNGRAVGTEAENDGIGEPWSAASRRAQQAIAAECSAEFGYPVVMVPDHKEWRPGDKIDRTDIDPDQDRASIAALIAGGPTAPTVAQLEEDDVVKQGHANRNEVTWWQWKINEWFHGHHDPRAAGKGSGLVIDGQFGPRTTEYVMELQKRCGYAITGVIDLSTSSRVLDDLRRAA